MEPERGDVEDIARGQLCLVWVSLLETRMMDESIGRKYVEG